MALDILLPYWGDPEMAYDAVRSVQAQDSDQWRLTIIDDCYPDPAPGEWFAAQAAADPRITYRRNETNLGITDNFRACLAAATQDLVVFLGCDDLLRPGYVRTVLSAHERFPDCDIIQPGVEVIDAAGQVVLPLGDRMKQQVFRPRVTRPTVLGGEALAASLLRANWAYWPSLAFRREALLRTPFLDDFPLIQDLALNIDLIVGGSRMLLLPDVVFAYRRHDASLSMAALPDGTRFAGERRFFELAARRVARLGWTRAERAARLHLGSRLYAATLLPASLAARSPQHVRALGAHLLGWAPRVPAAR